MQSPHGTTDFPGPILSADMAAAICSAQQCTAPMAWTWWLPWLAVKQPQSALAGPFLTLLVQMGAETTLPPLLKYLITDTTACLTDIESWWAGVNINMKNSVYPLF